MTRLQRNGKSFSNRGVASSVATLGIAAVAIIGLLVGFTYLIVNPSSSHPATTTTLFETVTQTEPGSTGTTTVTSGPGSGMQTTTQTVVQSIDSVTTQTVVQSGGTTTETTNETVQTTTTVAGNLVFFLIDSIVLNATTDSWTLTMTNMNPNTWNIQATLTATSGAGGSATTDSTISLYPFNPGVDSGTTYGVGPSPLGAGGNYCVEIGGYPAGSTVPDGGWDWQSCFIQAS